MDTDHYTLFKAGYLAISISTCLFKEPPVSGQNKRQKHNKADYLQHDPDRGPATGSLGKGTWHAKDRHLLRDKFPAWNITSLLIYDPQRCLPPI